MKQSAPGLKAKWLDRFACPPGKKLSLQKSFDPAWTPPKIDKTRAQRLLSDGIGRLARFQDMMYAQDNWALLVIFQAMDAAGKDGAIKHVMSGLNPQGCQVFSFKAPSAEELDHDYLWRSFKCLPERGRIGIFNRSYYEEVLVAKVHPEILAHQKIPARFMDKEIFERRYQEINHFERYLRDNGIITLKLFLHVSKAEQKKRFLERIETPEKNWKFSAADVRERACWDSYMDAYEKCLRATSTSYAPWYVIPADNKWVTRLAVAEVICRTLRGLRLAYPRLGADQKAALLEAKKQLTAEK